MITLANIRKAIYCLNKRLDLLEQNGISGGSSGEGASSSEVAEIRGKVEALESIISEGDNPTAAIDKFNEIVAFLESIQNTDTLSGILADIATLIPTNVSELLNDAGYLTQHLDISGKSDKLPMNGENAAVEDNIMSISSNGNPKDSGISINNIALKTGYYKNLHAGLADNLFGETQTSDVFTFRPTAGIQDIESGDAPVGGGTIKKVEGNAVAWNQLQNIPTSDVSITVSGLTVTDNRDGSYTLNGTLINGIIAVKLGDIKTVTGHLYYAKCVVPSIPNVSMYYGCGASANPIRSYFQFGNGIIQRSIMTENESIYFEGSAGTFDNVKVWPQFFDLTLLGIDNLTTVEEVEAWLANNIGSKDYYPYNEGELIPVKDFKVKSVGFNAWDGVYEDNTSINTDGTLYERSGFITTELIKVIPNCLYNHNISPIGITSLGIAFYDSNEQFISGIVSDPGYMTSTFTTPVNCRYVRASMLKTDMNDICINLSYDNRNGEYEEYWEREVGVDVTKVYGKLNGAGEYVQCFPQGMMAAGTAKDVVDLRNAVATIRIGKWLIGNMNWTYAAQGAINLFYSNSINGDIVCPTEPSIAINAVSAQYGTAVDYFAGGSKIRGLYSTWVGAGAGINIRINDERYENADDFKNAQGDEAIFAELATPLTYTNLIYRDNGVDTPVSELVYRVDNYGTEEVLLGNEDALVSCSPKMTIRYGINAADTIADLQNNYVSTNPLNLTSSLKLLIKLNLELSYNDLKDKPTIPQIWRGTLVLYDALVTNNQIDNNTIYVIIESLS